MAASLSDRFMKFVGEPDENGCRNWTGCLNSYGYGSFRDGTKRVGAHRFAYKLKHGPIPQGLCVRHRCDNRRCVEDSHLELGTNQDNVNDRMSRGRHNCGRGETHGKAKLTEKQVLAIRADTRAQKTIAAEYRVSHTVICQIKTQKLWRHVA